MPLRKIQRRIR